MSNDRTGSRFSLSSGTVLLLLWLVVFIIYYPAAKAGRVGDFPGWVKNVSTMPFWDYVNRTESKIPSLYQFTQVVTWTFYQFFGAKAWPWHLLYVTMQAVNGAMLFTLCRNIFVRAAVSFSAVIAFAGSLLFCICPHISEVVVWEPSFHYLQGLMFILGILLLAQRFADAGRSRYAWIAALLFLLSTFSLEIFYLTPLFVFTLFAWYRLTSAIDAARFRRAILFFSVPHIALFLLHIVSLNVIYHSGIGHIGTSTMTLSVQNFSKPLKYIFHILFMGRYFHDETRRHIYALCSSPAVLAIFYGLLAIASIIIALRFRQWSAKGKTTVLLFSWVLFSTALICPIWFPDTFVVIYDRYTYVLDAFAFMLLALLISYISYHIIAIALWSGYALVNVYFTHKVNAMWKVSGDMVNKLATTFPNDPSKINLIMNVPECYYGVQMIGSREEGEFRILYNAVRREKISNQVLEVSAYNIVAPSDGAHVMVVNDSTIHVTLNQWGTWWWWFGFGAVNFENEYYKVDFRDPGHWYELTLRQPAGRYRLLFVRGDEWRIVDMAKKNVEQY